MGLSHQKWGPRMRRQPTKTVFDWLVGFKHVCISIPRNRMVFTITPKDYYFVWRCLEFGDVWGELNHPQNHVVPFSWCSILMARCLSLQRRNQCLDCGRRGEMRFHYHRILTVLVYMVLHGSHQYTPVMLAYMVPSSVSPPPPPPPHGLGPQVAPPFPSICKLLAAFSEVQLRIC